MADIPEFRRYARLASQGIVRGAERRQTADELYDHATSLYDDAVADGTSHEQAVRDVLVRLGDPADVTDDLGSAHRPRVTASAVILIAVAVAGFIACLIGLYAWFFAINA